VIRTETHTLDAADAGGAKRRLANVYGFVVHTLAPAAVFSLVAWVRYEGEYTERYVVVREGVPVVGARLMESVRFATVAGAGDVYVTSVDEPGDVLGMTPIAARRGRLVWDSGDFANDNVITSPVLDCRDLAALRIRVTNGNATVARQVTLRDYSHDLATALGSAMWTWAATAAATTAFYGLADSASAGPASYAGCVPPALVLSLLAAGSGVPGVSRVYVTGR